MKISMKTNRIMRTKIAKTKVMKDITMKINTKWMNWRIPWKKKHRRNCSDNIRSLVIISVWWEWVGDRNLLGDTKISPWKCRYRLGIKVAIFLTSISKKVSAGGNKTLTPKILVFSSKHYQTKLLNWTFQNSSIVSSASSQD